MGNYFHLLLETPQANLVTGMKQLLATFSQGWNRARQRHVHVFQGRYKAVPVNGTDSDAHYFKALADYIHLDPARAGLARDRHGPLVSYPWSSLPLTRKEMGRTGSSVEEFCVPSICLTTVAADAPILRGWKAGRRMTEEDR